MGESHQIVRDGAVLVGEAIGNGPDVLLLHAGGESRAVWRPVMSALATRGFRSIAYDQRGHGESTGSVADGVIEFGHDACEMIAQLRSPVVVGGSLGGFALMLALEAMEQQVAGLVLVDVTPSPDPARTRSYLAPRAGLGASPLVEDILSKTDHLTRIVGGLELPVLLVCGGARSPLDSEARSTFAKLAPHAELCTIASAGHLVARDAPAELSRLLVEFAQSPNVCFRRSHHVS